MANMQKTIVISDVHMSNAKPYSWFQLPESDKLTNMLNAVAEKKDPFDNVDELVLLGDLFDLWLYPVDEVPLSVKEILKKNHFVSGALRHCVERIPHVYYMNGNHDMDVTADALSLLSSGSREIQWITTAGYRKLHPSRHLEHGHAADMFNAPDNSGDTIGGYPLGYFITRLVATAKKQNEVYLALRSLIRWFDSIHMAAAALPESVAPLEAVAPQLLTVPWFGPFMVNRILGLFETLADVSDETEIQFTSEDLAKRLDGKKPTVGDVKKKYGSLYDTWSERYSGKKLLDAMLATEGLDWYAKDVLAADPALKVVVMGHTHGMVSDPPYGNDGSWCDSSVFGHDDPAPTYMEIVGDTATPKVWE